MLAPLSWLKDYVDIDVTPKELEEKLFSCGFEVEELIEVGKDISNVVVGLVESCEPIPDTHLSLCQGRMPESTAPSRSAAGQTMSVQEENIRWRLWAQQSMRPQRIM